MSLGRFDSYSHIYRELRKDLPKTERFGEHARIMAALVAAGRRDWLIGYLLAMKWDWECTSKHFDADRFAAFRAKALAMAREVEEASCAEL